MFWGTLQGTASTTPPINGKAKGVVSVCRRCARHYKTNSRIISRIIRLELVVDYQPDYQVNYQPDYQPGSTEVQVPA